MFIIFNYKLIYEISINEFSKLRNMLHISSVIDEVFSLVRRYANSCEFSPASANIFSVVAV